MYKVKHSFNSGAFYFALWSDEHEKTEEKTKREVESSGIARLDGRQSGYL
jgi:hypothetical protein